MHARQWFYHHHADLSREALSVYICNTFNSVHRTAVLQAARTHFLSSTPWVCCERHDSTLFTAADSVASQVISNTRSVQQENPRKPDNLRPCYATCHPRGPPRHGFFSPRLHRLFFLDDALCAGTTPAVRCFFSFSSLILGFRRIYPLVSAIRPLVRISPKARALLVAFGRFPESCCMVPPDMQPVTLCHVALPYSTFTLTFDFWPVAFGLPMSPQVGSHLSAAEVSLQASIPSGARTLAECDTSSQKSLE